MTLARCSLHSRSRIHRGRSLTLLGGLVLGPHTLLLLLPLRPLAGEPVAVPEAEVLGVEVHALAIGAEALGPAPPQARQGEQLLRVGALLLRGDRPAPLVGARQHPNPRLRPQPEDVVERPMRLELLLPLLRLGLSLHEHLVADRRFG